MNLTDLLDPTGYKAVLALGEGETVNAMTHCSEDDCVYAATTEGVYKINKDGIVVKLDG